MDSFDNWKTSPPEPKALGGCEHCEDPIYAGEQYYVIDGGPDLVHKECFLGYAESELNAEKVNML